MCLKSRLQEDMDQMTILEAIDARHSVRAYRDEPIEEDKRRQLYSSRLSTFSSMQLILMTE